MDFSPKAEVFPSNQLLTGHATPLSAKWETSRDYLILAPGGLITFDTYREGAYSKQGAW